MHKFCIAVDWKIIIFRLISVKLMSNSWMRSNGTMHGLNRTVDMLVNKIEARLSRTRFQASKMIGFDMLNYKHVLRVLLKSDIYRRHLHVL